MDLLDGLGRQYIHRAGNRIQEPQSVGEAIQWSHIFR